MRLIPHRVALSVYSKPFYGLYEIDTSSGYTFSLLKSSLWVIVRGIDHLYRSMCEKGLRGLK